MDNRRYAIKHVRDKAKARYRKGTNCEICDTTEQLEFHHRYTLTPLFNAWLVKKKYKADTDEQVLAIRDEFIAEHQDELYTHTTTLCKKHHAQLHSVYGKDPLLSTAEKQKRWIAIQRNKHGLPELHD